VLAVAMLVKAHSGPRSLRSATHMRTNPIRHRDIHVVKPDFCFGHSLHARGRVLFPGHSLQRAHMSTQDDSAQSTTRLSEARRPLEPVRGASGMRFPREWLLSVLQRQVGVVACSGDSRFFFLYTSSGLLPLPLDVTEHLDRGNSL
jgi:hypothetical protein